MDGDIHDENELKHKASDSYDPSCTRNAKRANTKPAYLSKQTAAQLDKVCYASKCTFQEFQEPNQSHLECSPLTRFR
jgi:hypothetical protein